MPTHILSAVLVSHLLAAAAQIPDALPRPASRAPVFTLPAGEHSLTELVNLLGQIRKCEIDCATEDLGAVDTRKVMLQRELLLEAAAFEDAVTTVLFYRGLIVVPGDRAGHQRAIAMLDAARLQEAAVERTPAEILARPARIEFATTTLPTDPSEVQRRIVLILPLISNLPSPDPWAMTVKPVEAGVQLTASTEQIVHVLNAVRAFDDIPPEPAPAITWRSESLSWPGGKMSLSTFLKTFTATLDANLIGHADEREVELGAPAELAAAEWWSRATLVLRSIDHAIVPVVPTSRVFLLRALDERGAHEILWRATLESPEALLRSSAILPVMTKYELEHRDMTTVVNATRPAFRPAKSSACLTLAVNGPTKLLLVGLRDDVANALELVRKADQPK